MNAEPRPNSSTEPYQSLLAGHAVVVLEGWTCLVVRGNDRKTFLHNFSTNDVKRLLPGQSCEAFFLNAKGKILGHGLITCREAELVVVGAPGQGARLIEHLDRYILREDVQLRDATHERTLLLAARAVDISPVSFEWAIIPSERARVLEAPTGERERLTRGISEHKLLLADHESWEAARVEAGFPLYGIDFDDSNLPQEVGRDSRAISFTKGCYLGQETVARIDALGHVNQSIVGVRFDSPAPPPAGAELLIAGEVVGRVTSTTLSPKLGAPLALARLRRDATAVGTIVETAVETTRESTPAKGTVASLPIE